MSPSTAPNASTNTHAAGVPTDHPSTAQREPMTSPTVPSISAVIPAYNSEAVLPRAIESALAQSFPPCEIVVVDDGSSDTTLEVASRYGSPVRAFAKANGGPASARNAGVRETKGRWVAFLDADDTWFPRKLERQIQLIEDDVAVVCSRAAGAPIEIPKVITFGQLWRRNFIVNSSALVRKQAFLELGGLDEDPKLVSVEDYNFWLRVLAKGWRIVGVDEDLCSYDRGSASLSRQTLRFATAALANIEKLAGQLRINPALIREKELRTYEDFAADFFSARDMVNARRFLKESLRRNFGFKGAGRLALTYAPKGLLSLQRSIRAQWNAVR